MDQRNKCFVKQLSTQQFSGGHFTEEKRGHFAVEWWGHLRAELVGHYPRILQLDCPNITFAVVNYGMVAVFVESTTAGTWFATPYIWWPSTTVSYTLSLDNINIGHATLRFYYSNGSNLVWSTANFKVVTISGQFKQSHPHTNWSNYEEVMQVLNESKGNTE